MDLESEMVTFMQPLFGEMADKTVELQKQKLGIEGKELGYDEYVQLIDGIRTMCRTMAGDAIARKIYEGLKDILDREMA